MIDGWMDELKWLRVAIVSVPFLRVLLHLSDAVDERQKRREKEERSRQGRIVDRPANQKALPPPPGGTTPLQSLQSPSNPSPSQPIPAPQSLPESANGSLPSIPSTAPASTTLSLLGSARQSHVKDFPPKNGIVERQVSNEEASPVIPFTSLSPDLTVRVRSSHVRKYV